MRAGGAVLLLLALAGATPARAQPPQPDAAADPAPEPLEGLPDSLVITTRPSRGDTFDQAGAVAVVGGDDIARQGPSLLPEVMRDQPGIFVQQTGPGQAAPIVRGLIGSAVLMLVDGVRLNNAFFRPAPNQFFALVDVYDVERVELVRGPGSALHGSDAMGGTIRIFTPTPRFAGSRWQARGRALGQVGTADGSVISRIALAGGRQGLSASGGFTFQQHGDVRAGGGAVQQPSGYRGYAGNGKLAFEHGPHDAVVGLQYLVQPETPRYDELVPGFGRAAAPNDLFLFQPMSRLLAHGHYRYTSQRPGARLVEARLSFQRVRDDRRVREAASPAEVREHNTADTVALGLESLAVLGAGHVLTYGAELHHDQIASGRIDTEVATGLAAPGRSRYADGSRMESLGVYLQDTATLHPRLTVNPGLRLGVFWLDIPRADREVGASSRITDLTGGLGLLYRLSDRLNLASNVGRGVRAPNVFDVSSLGTRPGNRFQIPNPDLAPESIVGVDLGLKLLDGGWSGELFGFYSRYRNKIEAVPTGESTPEGRQIVQSANVGRVDLLGVEAALRAALAAGGELSLGLSYTRGQERLADGRWLPADRMPPLNGRLGLSWRWSERWWAEAFARATGAQRRLSDRDLMDARIDPSGTPAWTTLHLRAGGALWRQLRARVALDNLLDQRYREHGSGIDAPGFCASLTLEADF